ncbi:hypothetical protein AV521_32435 [Streptomyces sp. IMTB 2501]|uniref:hypothetical protein n=1 Tax=Streptomyces sp. IMTB 2501 TaxID=1776340 RepID=UPI00096BFAF6|nr:hypothetical protein [Streptomyces sp. IMTB 2501]OLZ65384.1 hypothetical protein AV521_32435 [Streptomyces sp. IMTB 2501]
MADTSGIPSAEPPRALPLTLLRATSLLFLFDTLLQAALAGLFITGDVGFLDLHAANAQVLAALSLVEAVAALLVWRSMRGPAWPFALALGLIVLVGAQMGLGAARMLGGHVPLALGVFGVGVALACWACTYQHGEGKRG